MSDILGIVKPADRGRKDGGVSTRRTIEPSPEPPGSARRPHHDRDHRPARDEERVHRRHVGGARRDLPRGQLLGRARGGAHGRGWRLLRRRRSRWRWRAVATVAPPAGEPARRDARARRRGAGRARLPGPRDRQGRRGVRRCRLRPGAGRGRHLVLGPGALLRHLRQTRPEPRLRDVVAAAPTHRGAQGEGDRVHGRDDERRTRPRVGIRERGRRPSASSTTRWPRSRPPSPPGHRSRCR